MNVLIASLPAVVQYFWYSPIPKLSEDQDSVLCTSCKNQKLAGSWGLAPVRSQPMFQPVLEGGDGLFMSSVHSPGLRLTGKIDQEEEEVACKRKLTSEHAVGQCVIREAIMQDKSADL